MLMYICLFDLHELQRLLVNELIEKYFAYAFLQMLLDCDHEGDLIAGVVYRSFMIYELRYFLMYRMDLKVIE